MTTPTELTRAEVEALYENSNIDSGDRARVLATIDALAAARAFGDRECAARMEAQVEVAKSKARADALAAEVAALKDMFERDATGLATALLNIRKHAEGYAWIAQGRGSYEWDDDRFYEEAGHALRPIIEMAKAAYPRSAEAIRLLANTAETAKAHDKRVRDEAVTAAWHRATEDVKQGFGTLEGHAFTRALAEHDARVWREALEEAATAVENVDPVEHGRGYMRTDDSPGTIRACADAVRALAKESP